MPIYSKNIQPITRQDKKFKPVPINQQRRIGGASFSSGLFTDTEGQWWLGKTTELRIDEQALREQQRHGPVDAPPVDEAHSEGDSLNEKLLHWTSMPIMVLARPHWKLRASR